MKWLVTMMVTPASASMPMRFQNSRRVSGSTPEVGSSRNRISGACSSDAASASRCLSPSGSSCATVLARPPQFEAVQRRVDGARLRGAVQAVDAGEEAQVLPHRQFGIEREALRHVADPRARRGGCVQQVQAGDLGAAAGGRQQAAQHAEGGGLAGAVRPQQAEDFAALHGEADVVDRDESAEAAHQVVHFDGGRDCETPPPLEGGGWGRGRRSSAPTPPPTPSLKGRGSLSRPASRAMKPSSKRGGSGLQRDAAELRRPSGIAAFSRNTMRSVSPGDQRVEHRRILRRAAGDGAAAARGTVRRNTRSRSGARNSSGGASASSLPWCSSSTRPQRAASSR